MMQQEIAKGAPDAQGLERRHGRRVSLVRSFLCREEPGGLLQGGKLLDLSLGGAAIRTRQLLSTGARLWVEIPASPGDPTPFVSAATVVWTHEQETGGCVAGIAFATRVAPRPTPITGAGSSTVVDAMPPPIPAPVLRATIGTQRVSRRPLALLVALLAVFLGLLAFIWTGMPAPRPSASVDLEANARRVTLPAESLTPLAAEEVPLEAATPAREAAGSPVARPGGGPSLHELPRNATWTRPKPADLHFASLRREPIQEYQAPEEVRLDAVWPAAMAADWAPVVPAAIDRLPAVSISPLEGVPPLAALRPHDSKDAPLPLRLEVHTAEFLLWVFRGDEVVEVFPIGIGAGDRTPRGSYYIVNRIEDPDWYNAGNPIEAGDPRNPLGEYWLGLGDAQGATPYGIHPTRDENVAGSARSRGCIRLRPEDAARLFHLCEVGTEVLVQ